MSQAVRLENVQDVSAILSSCVPWVQANRMDMADARQECEDEIAKAVIVATNSCYVVVEDVGFADGVMDILVAVDGVPHQISGNFVSMEVWYRVI